MFGINEARRRKQLAEEEAKPTTTSFSGTTKPKRETYMGFIHPRVVRESRTKLRAAENTYFHNIGTEDEKQAKKELKQAQHVYKEIKTIVHERNKAIDSGLGMLFSSKREYGQKPSKLKSKATRGIYRSPFKR